MDILQIQAELLRREHPHLLPNEDPDIERYFFLRNSGRAQQALNLYQFKLKPRYPNDEFRAVLLRLYRNRDPLYKELQTRAYRSLGARCLERTKRLIVFVADRADSYNPRDAYSTIRTAEQIKQVLPQDRYEATAAIERLLRYSQALNLRTQSLSRAAELVRAYLSDTLTVVDEERRRREDARKRAITEQRRRLIDLDVSTYSPDNNPGDLMNAVAFSPAELVHIEIPKAITRPEEKTLAFCAKYWNHTEDQAFERLLFFYSRKFGVKNYDVFKTIQRGKQNNSRDDEILASVMSCIITGYYYSVLGDRYVQQQWAAIKAKLLSPMAQPAAPAAAVRPAATLRPAAAPRFTASPIAAKAASPPKPATQPIVATSAARTAAARSAAVPKPATTPAAAAPRPVTQPAAATSAARIVAARSATAPRPATTPTAVASRPVTQPAAATSAARTAVAKSATAPRPATTLAATASKPVTPAATTSAARSAAARSAAAPKPVTPTAATSAARSAVARSAAAPRPATTLAAAAPRPVTQSAAATSAVPRPAVPAEKPRVSVSQRLQELSGRSYDVFQDRFLAHVRPAIRKVLGANRGIFFNLPLQAEDIVFNFLKAHYNDPYMNWEDSDDRARLAKMGFELNSIIPVIDECYGML